MVSTRACFGVEPGYQLGFYGKLDRLEYYERHSYRHLRYNYERNRYGLDNLELQYQYLDSSICCSKKYH